MNVWRISDIIVELAHLLKVIINMCRIGAEQFRIELVQNVDCHCQQDTLDNACIALCCSPRGVLAMIFGYRHAFNQSDFSQYMLNTSNSLNCLLDDYQQLCLYVWQEIHRVSQGMWKRSTSVDDSTRNSLLKSSNTINNNFVVT